MVKKIIPVKIEILAMRRILIVTILLCICGPARAETVLYFNSSPGDYIGQGQQQNYTPQQVTFEVSRNFDNGVDFDITNFSASPSIWWYLEFAAPNDATLIPGNYQNAVRYPFHPLTQPGLSFSSQ